jgi:transposase
VVLSWGDDVEVHALAERGWSISAIARHTGHDRKTIRAYLSGARSPGQRASPGPGVVDPFVEYCRLRLQADPHLWAQTLLDELVPLGFTGSYASLTAAIRRERLRPQCEPCAASKGRDAAIITHPPGEETQWDWVELPDPPAGWDCGRQAHLLVGALAHSGRWRGVLADAEDHGHLVAALGQVVERLGGVTQRWRFDRMATVANPNTGTVTAAFAGVAKHFGVAVDLCPPRHGNRKGVVEKANHTAAQRWWRTLGDDVTVADAQADLDRLTLRLDGRIRRRDGARSTVGELAAGEALRRPPTRPYPAELTALRTVTAQGLVAWRGNRYSVPPGLSGAIVTVATRLGEDAVRVVTAGGATVAAHRARPDGAGATVRDDGHVVALEQAVLAAFSTARPCHRKARKPPTEAALAEAARLRGMPTPQRNPAERVVIDLAA